MAKLGTTCAHNIVACHDLTNDFSAFDKPGFWFLEISFEGKIIAWEFENHFENHDCLPQTPWEGPDSDTWRSDLNEDEYCLAVEKTQEYIRQGIVYQANICRQLSAPLRTQSKPSAAGLHQALKTKNPAPYEGFIQVNQEGIENTWFVSASPELFLKATKVASGKIKLSTGPIKGTAVNEAGLTKKDEAENIMITDLSRNDLTQVGDPNTLSVDPLLAVEQHPGLVHLVSKVHIEIPATLKHKNLWADILTATLPPASVSGAPKSSALKIIQELEKNPRRTYCGAFGWINSKTNEAELAVGIRSFWLSEQQELCFGTGAGITWESNPQNEWRETELKAAKLISLASS